MRTTGDWRAQTSDDIRLVETTPTDVVVVYRPLSQRCTPYHPMLFELNLNQPEWRL